MAKRNKISWIKYDIDVDPPLRSIRRLVWETGRRAGILTAMMLAANIQESIDEWWDFTPSSPGEPPKRRTGRLVSAVSWHESSNKQFPSGKLRYRNEAYVKVDGGIAPHWFFLEYGTKHMAPRPFIAPAMKVKNLAFSDFYQAINKQAIYQTGKNVGKFKDKRTLSSRLEYVIDKGKTDYKNPYMKAEERFKDMLRMRENEL